MYWALSRSLDAFSIAAQVGSPLRRALARRTRASAFGTGFLVLGTRFLDSLSHLNALSSSSVAIAGVISATRIAAAKRTFMSLTLRLIHYSLSKQPTSFSATTY